MIVRKQMFRLEEVIWPGVQDQAFQKIWQIYEIESVKLKIESKCGKGNKKVGNGFPASNFLFKTYFELSTFNFRLSTLGFTPVFPQQSLFLPQLQIFLLPA